MTVESFIAVLGWSLMMNLALILLGLWAMARKPVWIFGFQSRLFGIGAERLHLIYFRLLGAHRILTAFFNLVPYLALRIVF